MIQEVSFDEPGRPAPAHRRSGRWAGEWASQSPLNQWRRETAGGGAEGNPAYCALVAGRPEEIQEDVYGDTLNDCFYFEAAPNWWTPSTTFDLRNTWASVYLKEIEPLTTAPGYTPHLFVVTGYHRDDPTAVDREGTGWFLNEPAASAGGSWVRNGFLLRPDERGWTRYRGSLPLEATLARVGFIGVMYYRGIDFTNVQARGVLGIDKFRYNLPE